MEKLGSDSKNIELCQILFDIIGLIDANNWGKAQFIWIHIYLKKEVNDSKAFNCWGNTKEWFIAHYQPLQSYFMYD